jgi:hypothetical protein
MNKLHEVAKNLKVSLDDLKVIHRLPTFDDIYSEIRQIHASDVFIYVEYEIGDNSEHFVWNYLSREDVIKITDKFTKQIAFRNVKH